MAQFWKGWSRSAQCETFDGGSNKTFQLQVIWQPGPLRKWTLPRLVFAVNQTCITIIMWHVLRGNAAHLMLNGSLHDSLSTRGQQSTPWTIQTRERATTLRDEATIYDLTLVVGVRCKRESVSVLTHTWIHCAWKKNGLQVASYVHTSKFSTKSETKFGHWKSVLNVLI